MNHELYDLREICGRHYTYCEVTLKSFAVPDDLSRTLWVTIYIWITNCMIARHLWALSHILWSHSDVICGARWFVTNFISYYLYTNHELYDRETFVGVITHTVESRWSHLRCQMICHELWGTVVASLHMNISCHTFQCVTWHICLSHVPHMSTSSRTCTLRRESSWPNLD